MKQKSRFLFLDLLRGWALIVMIETHIVNAFLSTSFRQESWFGVLNYINGLVAPGFLFVSGAVFYISTYGKTDELRTFGETFRKRLYRILLIFIAGYSLHLPFLSLKRMTRDVDPGSLTNFFSVDVLQCIAAGLLIILILKLIIRNEKIFIYLITAFFFVIVFTSFIVWGQHLDIPYYLAAYFNREGGSLFPLFPWLAFIFAGVIFSYFYLRGREGGTEKEVIKFSFYSGILFIVMGFVLLSEQVVPESFRAIRPHPVFTLQRIGYILFLAAFFWYYHAKKGEKKSFVTETAKESLLIYWLHLQIIYRKFFNGESLASIIGNTLNPFQCIIIFLALTLLMILAAIFWSRMKQKYPKPTMLIARGIVWVCVVIFLAA